MIIARTYIASQQLKQADAFKVVTPELQAPQPVKFEHLAHYPQLSFQPICFKANSLLIDKYLQSASPLISGLHRFMSRHL
eukprot:11729828-Karenia_brevis.AAC.1